MPQRYQPEDFNSLLSCARLWTGHEAAEQVWEKGWEGGSRASTSRPLLRPRTGRRSRRPWLSVGAT